MLIGSETCLPKIVLNGKQFHASTKFQEDGSLVVLDKYARKIIVYGKDFNIITEFPAEEFYFSDLSTINVLGDYISSKIGVRQILKDGTIKKIISSEDYIISHCSKKMPGFFIGRRTGSRSTINSIFGPDGTEYFKGIDALFDFNESDFWDGKFIINGLFDSYGIGKRGYTLYDKNCKSIFHWEKEILISPDGRLIAVTDHDHDIQFFDANFKEKTFDLSQYGASKNLHITFPEKYVGLPNSFKGFSLRNDLTNTSYIFDENLALISGPFEGMVFLFHGNNVVFENSKGENTIRTVYGDVVLGVENIPLLVCSSLMGLGTFAIQKDRNDKMIFVGQDGNEILLPEVGGALGDIDFGHGKIMKKLDNNTIEIYSTYDFVKNMSIHGNLAEVSECFGSPNLPSNKTFIINDGHSPSITNVSDLVKNGIEIESFDDLNVVLKGKSYKRKLLKI